MNDNLLPPQEQPQVQQPAAAPSLPPVIPPAAGLPTPVAQPGPKKYWGAWATIGFGAVIMVAIFAVQGIVGLVYVVSELFGQEELDIEGLVKMVESNGDLISVATFATAVIGLVLILIFIKVRQGASLGEYLALKKISKKAVLAVIGIVIVFLAVSFGLSYLQESGADQDMMVNAYLNVSWVPMLWIAVVIVAPVFEEVFFRGFLFVGLQQSKVGAVGATILTALPWALMHVQYNLIQILTIFILGIILGIVRHKSGSLWAPVIIHALNNLMAMVAVYFQVNNLIS